MSLPPRRKEKRRPMAHDGIGVSAPERHGRPEGPVPLRGRSSLARELLVQLADLERADDVRDAFHQRAGAREDERDERLLDEEPPASLARPSRPWPGWRQPGRAATRSRSGSS